MKENEKTEVKTRVKFSMAFLTSHIVKVSVTNTKGPKSCKSKEHQPVIKKQAEINYFCDQTCYCWKDPWTCLLACLRTFSSLWGWCRLEVGRKCVSARRSEQWRQTRSHGSYLGQLVLAVTPQEVDFFTPRTQGIERDFFFAKPSTLYLISGICDHSIGMDPLVWM